MGGDTERESPALRGASGDTFAALLDRLKRRGTTVMVVGDLPADVEHALSRRLMGHPDEPRYRLLAALRSTERPERWFPGDVGPDDEWVDVVDHGGLSRSAAASEAGETGTPEPPRAETLADRVEEWVARVSRTADPPPGAIRVGVPSLDVLLERGGVGAPRQVAERVAATMRDHHGVAHLYFPLERSRRPVQKMTVWVDVLVEVRTSGGRPEQRWAVQDTVETSWFPIHDAEPHRRVEQ